MREAPTSHASANATSLSCLVNASIDDRNLTSAALRGLRLMFRTIDLQLWGPVDLPGSQR